jgi:hypothetical protein
MTLNFNDQKENGLNQSFSPLRAHKESTSTQKRPSIELHPFYMNTIKVKRVYGEEPFSDMQRFDDDSFTPKHLQIDQSIIKKCLLFTRTASIPIRQHSKPKKQACRSFSTKNKNLAYPKTVIEPYNKDILSALRISPPKKSQEVSVAELTQSGLWKHIPDLLRNEMWIDQRNSSLKK